MSDQKIISQQQDRIEELEETILTLRSTFQDEGWMPHSNLRLSMRETDFCRMLLKRTTVTSEQTFVHLVGVSSLVDRETNLKAIVYRLRRKLTPHGVKITTVSGHGYSIQPEYQSILEGLNDQTTVPLRDPAALKRLKALEQGKDPLWSNNTTGVRGIYFVKRSSKWIAQIRINGKNKYLGIFVRKSDATKARRAAEIEKAKTLKLQYENGVVA